MKYVMVLLAFFSFGACANEFADKVLVEKSKKK
jgi:hypothetical protein